MYKKYLKRKQIEWKKTVKEKKRKRNKKRYLVPVGITNRDWRWVPSSLGWSPL